jgi:5-methylcytosine-specific restriction endonuclease McrA
MAEYKYHHNNTNKISRNTIIDELIKVAKHYNFTYFTRHDFDKISTECKGTAVLSEFGTWKNALSSLNVRLKPKKIDKNFILIADLFDEMKKIWDSLGHRPSKNEWDSMCPKYSYSTYKRRFGSWTNACLEFLEFIKHNNKKNNPLHDNHSDNIQVTNKQEVIKDIMTSKKAVIKKRDVPLKIRLKLLKRDYYRCVICGKSPSINRGVVLHVDHIIPYAKGGKTTQENLRTLCSECNLGKGGDEKY